MKPWAQVSVPAVSTPLAAPVVFDSVSNELVSLPLPESSTIYVCGITPYDATHIGHAATYVAFDSLIRLWTALGVDVNYAQNITDVDDPLIERAIATGRNWQDIATEQIDLFKTDMEALRVIPPRNYIGAVESIDLVLKRIAELQKLDAIYELDGDFYYDITRARLLGKIAHLTNDEMNEIFAQRGGDPTRAGKRHPLDALVWRAKANNDPYWPGPLGEGRPGWHIECSAIALEYLGDTITVQGGGSDLKFPHHEMSAAHAETVTGEIPFAQVFMHAGMVALDGEKMSKSLGNLVFVSKLRATGVDPMAIRLTILNHHYRSDWEWFDSELDVAVTRLTKWRTAFARASQAPSVAAELVLALANDLDTPKVIELVDDWADATLSDTNKAAGNNSEVATYVNALLGVI
jgi:L-cysteine:1D-myo-inositol 2-amino-2-deoxy-alpha-D-glucopyranoside ligase